MRLVLIVTGILLLALMPTATAAPTLVSRCVPDGNGNYNCFGVFYYEGSLCVGSYKSSSPAGTDVIEAYEANCVG